MAFFHHKNDEFAEHRKRAFEQLAAWGLKESRGFTSSGSILSSRDDITGVIAIEGQEPPAGWRLDRRNGGWVPKLTTKIGKQLKTELEAIQPPKHMLEDLPGMAPFAMKGNRIVRPAMFTLDETMYLRWHFAPDTVDEQIWTQIKISEWYVAKERYEETREPASADG